MKWLVKQFDGPEGKVFIEPPHQVDQVYDDLLLEVSGNMLTRTKLEVAQTICDRINATGAFPL